MVVRTENGTGQIAQRPGKSNRKRKLETETDREDRAAHVGPTPRAAPVGSFRDVPGSPHNQKVLPGDCRRAGETIAPIR